MRYRIIIDVDTDQPRIVVNQLAERMYNEAVTRYSMPVFCSTEKLDHLDHNVEVIRSK